MSFQIKRLEGFTALIFILAILLYPLVSGQTSYSDCNIYGNCKEEKVISSTITANGTSANDTYYWQGYTPSTYKTYLESVFTYISNIISNTPYIWITNDNEINFNETRMNETGDSRWAKYLFQNNNFSGTGNFTTTGSVRTGSIFIYGKYANETSSPVAPPVITAVGGDGQNASGTGITGAGSAISIVAGRGGECLGCTAMFNFASDGGSVSLTTGSGGRMTLAGGSSINQAGAGGTATFSTGSGGIATRNTTCGSPTCSPVTGGQGGNLNINSGAGGNAAGVNDGADNLNLGGTSGAITIQTGSGGSATTGTKNRGGAGGTLSLAGSSGGQASSTNTTIGTFVQGGNSGGVIISSSAGGQATLSSVGSLGNSTAGSSGTITIFTLAGGAASRGNRAVAGDAGAILITGGNGGTATNAFQLNQSGSGGNITLTCGKKGTAGTNGTEGSINFKDGYGNLLLRIFGDNTKDIWIPSSSQKLYFGASKSSSINYDGTNLVVNPKDVGTGVLTILGDTNHSGNNIIETGNVTPRVTNTASLGTSALRYLSAWLSGLNVQGDTNITGNLVVGGNVSIKRPYGMFSSTETQTIAVANTAYPITFNYTEDDYLVYKATNTNFSFGQTGDYLIELSAIVSTDTNNKHVEIWVQKNGVNIPRSNTRLEIENAGTETVIAVPFIIDMNMTDSFRLMWASDDAGTQMVYTTNTSYSPETPSIIMTISKISEITP